MSASVRVSVDLDPASVLRQMGSPEVIELIVEIDKAAQDWSFTLELAEHFAKLHKEWHAEAKESGDNDSDCAVCNVAK